MLNNKGFVVSAILYTILLAFLLFLGVTLAIFSSATSTIGNATEDLVNSTELSIAQVKSCDDNELNINPDNNILAQITSKYGILYWPRDFIDNSDESTFGPYKNIAVHCSTTEGENGDNYCNGFDLASYKSDGYFYLRVVQDGDEENAEEITFGNVCK